MNNKIGEFSFICLVLLFSLGCATKKFEVSEESKIEQKAPGWIDGASSKFDSEKYFIGVGVSNVCCTMDKKLSAAKNAARAEIAKIFQVKIESFSKETLENVITGKGKYSSNSSVESFTSFVSASTNMIMEGIEIKDSYKGKGEVVYALAVLKKEKALNLFEGKIKGELYAINKNLDEAAAAAADNNLLLAIKINRKILVSAGKIELLNAQIIVAGGKPVKLNPEYTTGFTQIKIDRLFSKVSISLVGKDSTVESHILEVLTGMGLRVLKNNNEADYIVNYSYSFNDDGSVKLSEDYVSYKAKSNLEIEFFIKRDEKVVAKINLEGRGVGKTKDLAAKHAVEKLGAAIQDELINSIFKVL